VLANQRSARLTVGKLYTFSRRVSENFTLGKFFLPSELYQLKQPVARQNLPIGKLFHVEHFAYRADRTTGQKLPSGQTPNTEPERR
jgi:hypothetical protein